MLLAIGVVVRCVVWIVVVLLPRIGMLGWIMLLLRVILLLLLLLLLHHVVGLSVCLGRWLLRHHVQRHRGNLNGNDGTRRNGRWDNDLNGKPPG